MADVATLRVLLQGRLIGTITRLPDDRSFFVFDRTYIEDEARPTLSLSFKDALGALITDSRPRQTRLPPFFSNLLPEGALREYLAVKANVKPEREFFLAWVLGHDLPGAVQILPSDPDSMPPENEGDRASTHAQGSSLDHVLRFSLAGVQLKFSAVQRATGGLTVPADGIGGSWIVKLPSPRFAGVPENEFAMMELARRIGIEVPETKLLRVSEIQGLPVGIELVGDTAFAIKRFDRQSPQGRVHIEDFAQVFGVYPERKYERANYRNIARVLWIETGEAGIVEFVRRLVFNTLIGNADMHLKNWSLIYPDGRRARLAPAYDYVSTIAYLAEEKMALKFVDSKLFTSMTRDSFKAFAAKAALPEKMTLDTVEQTVRGFAETWRRDDVPGLTNEGRDMIDSHLKRLPVWHDYTY
jgi:serine/threonine-protein kinase HipA